MATVGVDDGIWIPILESDGTIAPADFETAVSATGYGSFNILLLMAVIPTGWTTVFDINTLAFILPSAECDLELTLFRKGTLAAVTLAGMISSALVWRTIADRMGRRSWLLVGLLMDAVCNILGSSAQTYHMFLLLKFVSGTIVTGPYSILMTYLTEFHGKKYHPRLAMSTQVLFTLANVANPVLAWAIFPQEWSFTIFKNSFVYTSWRIFLLICSALPCCGFVMMCSLPESPKYLIARGNYKEALDVLRRMYSMNTGSPTDTFPIKRLSKELDEVSPSSSKQSPGKTIWKCLSEIKHLLTKPFLAITCVQIGSAIALSPMGMWLPQLITFLNHFNETEENPRMRTMCYMLNSQCLESLVNEPFEGNTTASCIPMYVAPKIYENASKIAAGSFVGVLLAGLAVERIGKKNVLCITFLFAGMCTFAINWSPAQSVVLILATFIITFSKVSSSIATAVIRDVIPASTRVMAEFYTTMNGYIGTLTGNLLFAALLDTQCFAVFMFHGGLLVACIFSLLFVRKPQGTV